MWVRGAAIRPVPAYAVVPEAVLSQIERDLANETDEVRRDLDVAFTQFEKSQPHLSEEISEVLSHPLDDTALALGYFLSIAVFLAFCRAFGSHVSLVTETEVRAAREALLLEETLRAENGLEPFDIDDVVAVEQPALLAFVHEHVDAALDPGTDEDRGPDVPGDIDVDDVHRVYRAILVMILALSHAVTSPGGGRGRGDTELLA